MIKLNNYIERKLGDRVLIIPVVNNIPNTKKVTVLEGTGEVFWDTIKKVESYEIAVQAITKIYDVDELQIRSDLISFLENLKENNIVIDYNLNKGNDNE